MHRFLLPLAALLAALPAAAATVTAAPGELPAVLAAAQPGDTVVLAAGVHEGPVRVDKPLTLAGEPGAVVDGRGVASTITVAAPGVTVRGLEIRHSGTSLIDQNSGIFLDKTATGAVVEGNRLVDNLIGIYVWGAADSLVQGNTVDGLTGLHPSERGNGIQVWNAPGTRVVGNTVRHGRDGIFVTTSKRNVFRGNRLEDVRIAVHYMYTNDSELSENVSVGNTVGFAVMFSNNLKVRGNLSRGDRDHGLLLNYANGSAIEGNAVLGRFAAGGWAGAAGAAGAEGAAAADADMPRDADSAGVGPRSGTGKCVFIYNANKNRLAGNRFEGCEIGVHFTAGSERNAITGNAFVANRTQVKYVGTRALDWSAEGRGNYWSDNAAFDLDGDGIADEAYRPNDVVDRVLWAYPVAKLLMNSPGVQVIRWAQKRFPALHPGGVVDSRPLMAPPPLSLPAQLAADPRSEHP
ncbi:nitrous oxide reductase family maturation protein NosD [Azospirillum sp. ST 5-10]|uniref:nitrous oxide reductase family maturation protein NosD n=1 Tax=unclassified Azospirillum TaxID=2630922 RepID=UPI003F49F92E